MYTQTTAWVFVSSCLLLSASLGQSVDIEEDDNELHTLEISSIEAQDTLQTTQNNSPRIKRYGISNETLVIPGKLRDVSTEDVMTKKEEGDDEQIITLEKINASDDSKQGLETGADNTEIRELYWVDLEMDQHQSLKSSPPGIPETYKLSQSLQGRPKFHIADDFNFDNEYNDIPLRREARFDVESDHFPSFATQFFGSFGEFSQSSEGTESSHNPDHYYAPHSNNYNHKPHSDYRPHHNQPRPLRPPKREIISQYHDKPGQDKYNSIKDVSALYVEDPWKHIDKVVDSAPPYVPKPLHQDGYSGDGFPVGVEQYNHIPEPAYEPPQPVYIPPEPELYEPPRPAYEPVHVDEYIPEVYPVYQPPKPKPVFHYSKPNYRPPIQPKPIKDKHHSIVNVPYSEPAFHHDTPHQEVHSLGGEDTHHPSEYLHPVQHMKDKKGELDFYKKYSNRNHGSKALNFKVPLKLGLTGTRAGGARFLHLLGGGRPGSTFTPDLTEYGGETSGYGAFRWFSNHQVTPWL